MIIQGSIEPRCDFSDVPVIEVMVKPGDSVKVEQSLITIESDKASMEIPSSAAGVVKELRVKLGDKISEGSLLLVLEGEDGLEAEHAPVAHAVHAVGGAEQQRRRDDGEGVRGGAGPAR